MVADNYNSSRDRGDPIVGGEAVDISSTDHTPSQITRVIYVGVTGNLKVTTKDGSVLTFSNVAVGWHPIRAKLIWKTGTTATTMVVGW